MKGVGLWGIHGMGGTELCWDVWGSVWKRVGEGSVVVGDLWKEVGGMERTGGGEHCADGWRKTTRKLTRDEHT